MAADLNAQKWKLLSVCVLEYRCATTTGTATVRQVGPPRSVTPKATGAAWTVVPPTMASGSGGWGCLGLGMGLGLLGAGPGAAWGWEWVLRAAPVLGSFGGRLCTGFHWQRILAEVFCSRCCTSLSQDGVGICRDLGWFSSGGSCHLGTKILLDFSISRLGYVKGSLIPAQGKAN